MEAMTPPPPASRVDGRRCRRHAGPPRRCRRFRRRQRPSRVGGARPPLDGRQAVLGDGPVPLLHGVPHGDPAAAHGHAHEQRVVRPVARRHAAQLRLRGHVRALERPHRRAQLGRERAALERSRLDAALLPGEGQGVARRGRPRIARASSACDRGGRPRSRRLLDPPPPPRRGAPPRGGHCVRRHAGLSGHSSARAAARPDVARPISAGRAAPPAAPASRPSTPTARSCDAPACACSNRWCRSAGRSPATRASARTRPSRTSLGNELPRGAREKTERSRRSRTRGEEVSGARGRRRQLRLARQLPLQRHGAAGRRWSRSVSRAAQPLFLLCGILEIFLSVPLAFAVYSLLGFGTSRSCTWASSSSGIGAHDIFVFYCVEAIGHDGLLRRAPCARHDRAVSAMTITSATSAMAFLSGVLAHPTVVLRHLDGARPSTVP